MKSIKFIDTLFLLGTLSVPDELINNIYMFLKIVAPEIAYIYKHRCHERNLNLCPNILSAIILTNIDTLKPFFTKYIHYPHKNSFEIQHFDEDSSNDLFEKNIEHLFEIAKTEIYYPIPRLIVNFEDYLCIVKNSKRHELAVLAYNHHTFDLFVGDCIFLINGITENSILLVSQYINALTKLVVENIVAFDYYYKVINIAIQLSIIITRKEIFEFLISFPFISNIIKESDWIIYVQNASNKSLIRGYLNSDHGIYLHKREIKWIDVQKRNKDDIAILLKLLSYQFTIPFYIIEDAIISDNSDLLQLLITHNSVSIKSKEFERIASYIGKFSCNFTVYIFAKYIPKTIDTLIYTSSCYKRGQVIDKILCLPFASNYIKDIYAQFKHIVKNSIRIGTVTSLFSHIIDSLIYISGKKLSHIISHNNNEIIYYLIWHVMQEDFYLDTSFEEIINNWFIKKTVIPLFKFEKVFLNKVTPSLYDVYHFVFTNNLSKQDKDKLTLQHYKVCDFISRICDMKIYNNIKINLEKHRMRVTPFIDELLYFL